MLESAERELIGIAGTPYRLVLLLSKILHQYTTVVIDTRPSFSLMSEMSYRCPHPGGVYSIRNGGSDILPSEVNDLREGWRHPNLRVSGILVTKMDHPHQGTQPTARRTQSASRSGRIDLRCDSRQ
jgi:hypothetical protein